MKQLYLRFFHIILPGIFILLIPPTLKAQQMPGLSKSNYSGIHGVLVNPSQAADTRYSFYLTLGGLNYTVNSSYKKNISATPILYPFLAASGNGLYYESLNSGTITPLGQIHISSEILGPSFVVKVGQNTGFAVFTRYRSYISGQNIPQFFGDFYSGETSNIIVGQNNEGPLAINTNTFSEIGLSVGQTIFQHKHHYLKAGGTYKRLTGTNASFFKLNNPQYTISGGGANETSLQLTADSYQLGYTGLEPMDFDIKKLFSPSANPGTGHAFDIGLSYEFRPKIERYEYFMDGKTRLDSEKNKYRLKLSMTLLDLGSIRYTSDSVQSISGLPEPLELTANGFRNIGDSPIRELHRLMSQKSEMNGQKEFTMNLPSRYNLQADFHVAKGFYMNFMMENSMKEISENNSQLPSFTAITPRLESEGVELAIPVSFVEGYEKVAVGAGVKIGFIEMGISNALALFGPDKSRPTNIYLGFRIFNMSKKRKNSDNDGVSDRHDICPDVQGIWEFLGCPDSDLDGVEDKLDECPEVAGNTDFNGCPDTDGDKIRDKSDLCPYEKGLALFYGCPDSDGDGIPDYEDDCPALAGLAGYYGCPDSDGDGVPDSEDACARTAGLAEFSGCPDTDGDGVPDSEDECPAIVGSFKFSGCPDSDGDEVPDQKDNCPNEAGTVLAGGCPDNDLDGVADKEDQCPETPGDMYNKGCPVYSSGHEEIRIDDKARQTIKAAEAMLEFDGQLQLTAASKEFLAEAAQVLQKYPESRMLIMYFNEFGGNETTAPADDNGWNTTDSWNATPSLAEDSSDSPEEKALRVKQFFLEQNLFTDQVVIEQKWVNDIPEKVELNQNSKIMLRVIK